MSGGGHVILDRTADRTTVVLFGEIDASLTRHLDALRGEVPLDTGEHHEVRVDVGDVTFMDSTGVAFLVRLTQRITPRRVVLVRPSDPVLFLLRVTRLSEIIDVEP